MKAKTIFKMTKHKNDTSKRLTLWHVQSEKKRDRARNINGQN